MFTSMLKIEIDGHFHGSSDVPKPWVAEIGGLCSRYGLERRFLDPLNDWKDARRAWSGNVYGRVAHFPLRDGHLYEVSRCRGTSSRRYVAREFVCVEGKQRHKLSPSEALARVDGLTEAKEYEIADCRDGGNWVACVRGVGTPDRLGFVTSDGRRLYRLPSGLFEVRVGEAQELIRVDGTRVESLDQSEALQWLTQHAA